MEENQQEKVDQLEQELNPLQPEKKKNLVTEVLEEILDQELPGVEVSVGLGKQELKCRLDLDDETQLQASVRFKKEVRIDASISKKF